MPTKTLTKKSPEWQEIISQNKTWFSRETIKFFRSTIFWGTLAETSRGKVFITSEWNFSQDKQLFTLRLVSNSGIETFGEYQGYDTLASAIRAIKEIV